MRFTQIGFDLWRSDCGRYLVWRKEGQNFFLPYVKYTSSIYRARLILEPGAFPTSPFESFVASRADCREHAGLS